MPRKKNERIHSNGLRCQAIPQPEMTPGVCKRPPISLVSYLVLGVEEVEQLRWSASPVARGVQLQHAHAVFFFSLSQRRVHIGRSGYHCYHFEQGYLHTTLQLHRSPRLIPSHRGALGWHAPRHMGELLSRAASRVLSHLRVQGLGRVQEKEQQKDRLSLRLKTKKPTKPEQTTKKPERKQSKHQTQHQKQQTHGPQ